MMKTMEYKFNESLEKGKQAEQVLDKYFSNFFEIETVSLEVELVQHYDRVFIRNGKQLKIEYKTDFQSHKTGNAFIETMSNIEKSKPGWIRTSQADFLVYYIPEANTFLYLRMIYLKMAFRFFEKQYKTKSCTNVCPDGSKYHSEGVLVPVKCLIPLGKMMKLK